MLAQTASAEPSAKQAYDFAARTLKYVETSAKRPKFAARLTALKSHLDKTPVSEILKLRREIILSHPALAFDSLLINKRPVSRVKNHMVDHYLGRFSLPGEGLVILKDWKTAPKQTFITKGRLPAGTITHPDLSFDAKKAVFAFCDHRQRDTRRRAFHLYEIALDSTGLRQLTGDSRDPMTGRLGRMTQIIEDFDPCYLPDSGIAFTSTRTMAAVRCANYTRYNPAFVLHRCEGDGSKLRALSFGELNEYDPALRSDGRLVYTRWEYINRNITTIHGLWTTSPDGTAVEHFYGNNTIDPNVVVEARAIPGSRKVVASAVAHHRYYCGTVIVIDTEIAADGLKPLTRITPEIKFPERRAHSYMDKPRVPDENGIYPYGLPYNLDDKTAYAAAPFDPKNAPGPYAMPFPLSEELFLVAAREKKTGKFAIYLIDALGGRELIFRDPAAKMSCWAPTPIRTRKKPPVRASLVSSNPYVKDGAFFIQDVYQNRFDSTGVIKRGSVKAIRIIQPLDQPAERAIPRGRVLFELPKRILGTVPVEASGSTAFRAPSGVPMQLQLLDKNGMALMTMRSFVYLHPGETASCVGCHEPKTTAPPPTIRGKAKIHEITVPPWRTYEKGMSYSRTVQPVIDRYCIACHGLDKDRKAPMSLIATPRTITYKHTGIPTDWPGKITVPASEGYHNLMARKGVVAIAQAYNENTTSKPKDYFAHAGKLAGMMLAGHPDKKGQPRVKLDPAALRRIIDWLDVNAPFAGVYSFNRPENRTINPGGEKALRAHIAKTFGKQLAAQPIAALVNAAEPDASRILLAPLAKASGGWGQITPAWKSTDDAAYKTMKKLVYAAIEFEKYQDIAGTCGRGSKNGCLCKACWIRETTTVSKAARTMLVEAEKVRHGLKVLDMTRRGDNIELLHMRQNWARRHLDASLILVRTTKQKIAAVDRHIATCKADLKMVKARLEINTSPAHVSMAQHALAEARYLRADLLVNHGPSDKKPQALAARTQAVKDMQTHADSTLKSLRVLAAIRRGGVDPLLMMMMQTWTRRSTDARLRATSEPKQQIAALRRYFANCNALFLTTTSRYRIEAGRVQQSMTRHGLAEAKHMLAGALKQPDAIKTQTALAEQMKALSEDTLKALDLLAQISRGGSSREDELMRLAWLRKTLDARLMLAKSPKQKTAVLRTHIASSQTELKRLKNRRISDESPIGTWALGHDIAEAQYMLTEFADK